MEKKLQILKDIFGHKTFKAFQEEIINSIIDKNDSVCILPTGAGKSLCYQLPNLLIDGICVVISPLVALMQDQIKALNELNIKAYMINSLQTQELNQSILKNLQDANFLYIAPERLSSINFIHYLKDIKINYFVIDEAHCVSVWGHEFRNEYRNLGILKQNFPNTPIACFTATATKKVQIDIIKSLKLQNYKIFKSITKRDNLIIKVEKRISNGNNQILKILQSHKNECGIIYTFTRKEAEDKANFLQKNGFNALAYHAKLPPSQKDEIYKNFAYEKTNIIVATIAFGMGIDKSNLRFIIHTSLPKSIENYYQEIGRAGRDGEISYAYLLFSKSDEIGKKAQINDIIDENYKSISLQKLNQMYEYCISSKCRHEMIAKYFEDDIQNCKTLCDNCTRKIEYEDITTYAQKLLSCIYRTNQTYGQTHIIDILRGSSSKKIFELNHDKLSVYAIGKDLSKNQWISIIETLLDKNALILNEFKSLKITNLGYEILKAQTKIGIDKELLKTHEEKVSQNPSGINEEIFEKFKNLRKQIANESEVPAYIVFDDKTLRQISINLPQNEEEFLSINGVGKVKFEKYNKVFFKLIDEIKTTYKDKIPTSKLTQTHLETLNLIQNANSAKQIAAIRNLTLNTILSHINILNEHEKITKEQQQELFTPITIPCDIKEWITQGISLDSLQNLRKYIVRYELINKNEN